MAMKLRRFQPLGPPMYYLLLLSLVVGVVFGAWPAWAQPGAWPVWAEPCALPTAQELGLLDPPPEPSWTRQEGWTWKQPLAGEVADFNQLYCEKEPLDPSAGDEVWQNSASSDKARQVSERFLLDALRSLGTLVRLPDGGRKRTRLVRLGQPR